MTGSEKIDLKKIDPRLKKMVLAIIQDTLPQIVREVTKATFTTAEDRAKEDGKYLYRQTEKRVYSVPILREKLAQDRARLEDLEGGGGLQQRSKSIVRYQRAGYRVSPEEMLDAVITDLRSHIAADEEELLQLEAALDSIKNDTYYQAIEGRYLKNEPDEVIAEALMCDPSTIRKHRGRLVRVLAIRLYGSDAVFM